MANYATASINGVTIDFTDDNNVSDVVDAINAALVGELDVVAAATTAGDLRLSSASGLTITFDDTATHQLDWVLYLSQLLILGMAQL